MDNINKRSVLEKAFERFNTTQVVKFIKENKVGYVLNKKKKSKSNLKNDFLLLENALSEKDFIDLAEMAVMRRKRGLPAYTYHFKNLGKLKDKNLEQLKREFVKSYIISPVYEVALAKICVEEEKIILSVKVKEYGTAWKTNVQDLTSLTAVYDNKVIIEKGTSKISIEAGDDNIEEVIESFLSRRLGIILVPYTIKVFNSSSDQDSASEKTMLIFDYIYNRLPFRGVSSSFNDVKFKMSNTSLSGGVRGVTLHGDDIITSDEACKYITLSNDIVSFKTTSIYQGSKVNVQFSLKGKDFDKLKIVILDNKSEAFKQEVMNLMQEEYILMCNEGIKDINNTRRKLEPIYQSFIDSRS